jgi:hypothetical protein
VYTVRVCHLTFFGRPTLTDSNVAIAPPPGECSTCAWVLDDVSATAGGKVRLAPTMEYLVTMTTQVPAGTSGDPAAVSSS